MANAANLALLEPVRMLLAGYPGAGKTGSLAALANMGYKIRYIDFDGNYSPLLKFTKPEFLKNIDIQTFEDKLRAGGQFIETVGLPKAFAEAVKSMDQWKYTEADGTVVDLGASKDWGCDTIVVLDTLGGMGTASFRRVRSLLNKTPLNTTQQVWGMAMAEQEAFIEKLTASNNKFHVIVLSHLKIVAPREANKDASDALKEQTEKVMEIIPARLFPNALGQGLPQTIGGHFPTLVLIEPEYKPGGKVRRVIRTQPRPELDLKLPAILENSTLDISTGLADIFRALAPPLSGCTNTTPAITGTEGVNTNG